MEHEWKHFKHNRKWVVRHAKGKADYLLVLDADHRLNVHDKDFKQKLNKDYYMVNFESDNTLPLLVSGHKNMSYPGPPVHEVITCQEKHTVDKISSITITDFCDGANRASKFRRDIDALLKYVKKHPQSARSYFYLGQSYFDLNDYNNAIKYYEECIKCSRWCEEKYYALYKIGCASLKKNDAFERICERLLRAYLFRPTRLEALFELVQYCRQRKYYNIGYQLGKSSICTDYPKDVLFMTKHIHNYRLMEEIAICAYWIGHYKESYTLFERILKKNVYMYRGDRTRIIKNCIFPMQQLKMNINNLQIFSQTRRYTRLKDLIQNKTLAIVGNANNENENGKEIDSKDIVIRFNNFSNDFKIHYGERTDIWASSFCDQIKSKENFFKHICCPLPLHIYKHYKIYRTTDINLLEQYAIEFIPLEYYEHLISVVPNPSTGLCLLFWIYKILGTLNKADLFGFSYFEKVDGKMHYSDDVNISHHDGQAERNFIKFLCE